MPDSAQGIAIAFGTSSFTAVVTNLEHTGIARESLRTSGLATTVAHTFMPGDLVDGGELRITFLFDPNTTPPYDQPAETITVTFPTPSGGSSGATAEFSGFMTDFQYTGEVDQLMEAQATLKVSGAITWTDSA